MRPSLIFLLALPRPEKRIRKLVNGLVGSLATRLVFSLKISLVFCALFSSAASVSAEQKPPIELLFVTSDYCPFCKAWERDIGQIYDSTLYAKKAQLRRVDLSDVDSALPPGSADVFGTPTFLIVGNNTEIGRIEGYQSREMFFWALSEYIQP